MRFKIHKKPIIISSLVIVLVATLGISLLYKTKKTDAAADSNYSQDVLSHNTIGLQNYWRMGDASTSFTDLQGGNTATGHGGITYQSLALLPGDSTKAAKFDGSTGYASLTNNSDFNFEYTDNFTVEALIEPASVGSTNAEQFIACKDLNADPYTGWCFGLVNVSGNLKLEIALVNNLTYQVLARGSQTVSINTPHHVSVTYIGGSSDGGGSINDVQFEVDGVIDTGRISVHNTLGHNSILSSANATIGSRNGTGGFFNGYIQELAIYKMYQPTFFAAQVFNHWSLFNGSTPLTGVTSKPAIILDSDLGEDIDDAGDIAVLAKLAVNGEATIPAIINTTSIPAGIAEQRVIATSIGATVGVYGAYKGNDLATANNYAAAGVTRFGATYAGGSSDTRSNYTDATLAYRSALNAAANNSVTVVVTGEENSLNNFLNSTSLCSNCSSSDTIPLNGIQIANAKIKRIVMAAALFPQSSWYKGPYGFSGGVITNNNGSPEYNFSAHNSAPSASAAIATLLANNIETVFVGDEQGASIFSGPPSNANPLTNPLKYAYDSFASATGSGSLNSLGKRPSWGQLGVLFAVRGFGPTNAVSPGSYFETYMLNGAMTVSNTTGANTQIGPSAGTFSSVAALPNMTNALGTLFDGMLAPATIPGKPTAVSAVRGNGQATIAFTAPVDDGGFTITSYTVTSTPGNYTATGVSGPLTVSGLANGTSYTFTVHTTNPLGNSAESDPSSSVIPVTSPTVTTQSPSSVTGTTALGNGDIIDTGGENATVRGFAYATDSSVGHDCSSLGVTSTVSDTASYSTGAFTKTIPSLNLGTYYCDRSYATNIVGTGYGTWASFLTLNVPDKPTAVSAVRGNGQATVSFTAPSDDGGSTITSYTVTSTPGNYTATGVSSPLTVTGLTNSTSYTFTVHATNSVGDSAESDPSSGIIPITSSTPTPTSSSPASNPNSVASRETTTPIAGTTASPVASFTIPTDITNIEVVQTITFDASSSGSNIAKYEWDFGDGATSNEMKVDHKYDTPGRYTVTLTVTDKSGNISTVSKTVDIRPPVPTISNIKADGTSIVFEGQSFPKATINLTIHSNPYTGQTVADKDGKFSYTVENGSETLGEGDHTVLANATLILSDNTKLKSKDSKTYDFKVSVDNGKLKVEMGKTKTWKYISLSLGLLLLLAIGFVLIKMRKRKR